MDTVICKKCNLEVEVEHSANCIQFCPKCFSIVFMECEYGYGPVTPCYIFLGNIRIGIVTKETYKYYLDSEYLDRKIELENTYLEALREAELIIQRKLNEHKNNK